MTELMRSTSQFGLLAGYKLKGTSSGLVITSWRGSSTITVTTHGGQVVNVVSSDGGHVDWRTY